jgi:hypothetical protein
MASGRAATHYGRADPASERPGLRRWPGRISRRLLLGAAALSGCAIPDRLQPPAAPADRSVVFHALLTGQAAAPLGAPDSPWMVEAEPPAAVAIEGGTLRITSVPGRRAWASPRLPFTPLLDAAPGQIEDLLWEGAITLEHRYFIVCELRFSAEPGAILIQATPFDIQVFHDTERPGGGVSESVSRLVGHGGTHFWRLRLAGARLDLSLDGSTIWTRDGVPPLARVAFGETRTDPLHGGTMRLRDLVYVRRPVRT